MSDNVPRTDICEQCEREIVPEVKRIRGQHELIHQSRTADEDFDRIAAGTVTVVFACACSRLEVEYGTGTATAWDVPDAWMWDDETLYNSEADQ